MEAAVSLDCLAKIARPASETETGLMRAGELFLSLSRDERPSPVFDADPKLIAHISTRLLTSGSKSRRGVILSGSGFYGSHQAKCGIRNRWPDACMVDMDSVAVAFAASRMGIPFCIAKTVADRFGTSHRAEQDYPDFLEFACANAARIVEVL
jgi:adenosylhomocysteine nucleosidase